jgi:hypothetical protein
LEDHPPTILLIGSRAIHLVSNLVTVHVDPQAKLQAVVNVYIYSSVHALRLETLNNESQKLIDV